MLEDLLAIELVLAREILATAPASSVLGAGTGAALRMAEESIAAAEPSPDAVHRALRDRFPARAASSSALIDRRSES
jgi:histidine ammonia-lyase